MRKKIKDLTLEEVGEICDRCNDDEYNVPPCNSCPFKRFKYVDYGRYQNMLKEYCPFETTISMIGELANKEIEVEDNE